MSLQANPKKRRPHFLSAPLGENHLTVLCQSAQGPRILQKKSLTIRFLVKNLTLLPKISAFLEKDFLVRLPQNARRGIGEVINQDN